MLSEHLVKLARRSLSCRASEKCILIYRFDDFVALYVSQAVVLGTLPGAPFCPELCKMSWKGTVKKKEELMVRRKTMCF